MCACGIGYEYPGPGCARAVICSVHGAEETGTVRNEECIDYKWHLRCM